MSSAQRYDCAVIGGGPAGATAATVLAQHGRRVAVIERERFPRYHVGESLMPYTWYTFERLGVLDWFAEAACPQKYSVQFVSTSGKVSQPFYFFETIKHPCATTWQVRRSDFDRMLLDNARAKGVEVRQGAAVREVLMDGQRAVGVRADLAGGGSETFPADAVIDASGRDSFLASRLGMKRRDPDLNKIAIFTYYRGARRDPGLDAGATTVAYIPEKGLVLVHPAAGRHCRRRCRGGKGLPLPRHARPGGDLRPRGGGVHLDRGSPAARHARRAGARHRRIQLSRRGDRGQRLLPGR